MFDVLAQGVPGLSRPPGVGDPGPGRSSGARRTARPGHQASGQPHPRPPSRGPEIHIKEVVKDGIRNIKIMVRCAEQSGGPRLGRHPAGGLQPPARRVDSEQQQPHGRMGLLHQRGGPASYSHGFGGPYFHAVFQDQEKLCCGDAL